MTKPPAPPPDPPLPIAAGEPEPAAPVHHASFDNTPLPAALPYHVADPTTRVPQASARDLPVTEDAPTRPGSERGVLPEVSGIANAARRISASLIGARVHDDEELSIELDTQRLPARAPGALGRIARRPPTSPLERSAGIDAVPDVCEDDADDDDQTVPRELPMGIRRARPPSLAGGRSAAQGALAFAFFAPLPAEHRAAVLSRFSRRSVPPGTVVIRQGELAPSLALVSSGRLEVRAERAGQVIDLGVVGPGEYIGEAPLLARAPSQASVVAVTEAELLLLSPRDLYEIAGAFPALWAALKETAARRAREHAARR